MRCRAFCAGLLLLLSSGALAQTYDMTIHLANGETVTIPHDDIQRIVFALAPTGTDDPTDPDQPPCAFLLLQNHPNPFNPSTTIEYSIPSRGEVTVRVYDMKGSLVRELVRDTLDEGRHQVTWNGWNDDGAPVASGVYLCAVSYGGRALSQSLTLVR